MTMAVVVGPIPTLPVSATAGLAFGIVAGTAIAATDALLGALPVELLPPPVPLALLPSVGLLLLFCAAALPTAAVARCLYALMATSSCE